MNEVAMKGILKLIKNMISPEQIKQAAGTLIQGAIDYKNQIELDPIQGETTAIGIAYEVENAVYCGIAVINAENRITRFENIQTIDSLIEKFLKNL